MGNGLDGAVVMCSSGKVGWRSGMEHRDEQCWWMQSPLVITDCVSLCVEMSGNVLLGRAGLSGFEHSTQFPEVLLLTAWMVLPSRNA